MTLKNKSVERKFLYETPLVKTLDILSEGVLCGSFDEDNSTEIFDRLPSDDL